MPDADWPELSPDYSLIIYILNIHRFEDFSEGVCDSPKNNSLFGVEESVLQKSAIFGL